MYLLIYYRSEFQFFYINIINVLKLVSFTLLIDKKQAEKKVIKKDLFEHCNNLKHLKGRHYEIIHELLKLVGKVILRILLID